MKRISPSHWRHASYHRHFISIRDFIAKKTKVKKAAYLPFSKQRGAYKVIMRNRFMFIKDNLHPVMENIVLLHELGHDTLHREEASRTGGFEEFNIFEMQDNRMEYEANIFASQVALPDDDFLELAERGYDTQQIARALNSDINLVALKADTLISQGYRLRPQEHCNDFLKYNR